MANGAPIWFATYLNNAGLKNGQSEADRIFNKLQGGAEDAGSGIEAAMKKAGAAVGAYLSVNAFANFARQMVDVRGQFQQLEIAFGTMLKSGDKAKKLMSDLSEFAATTPFGLQSSASAAKQLLAYGSSVETLIDEMRMLGDVAAGTSQPIGDLVYLYGTLRTQGRAYRMDIRQFAGRGIPIYDELAKVLRISKDQVDEFVSAGEVGFAEVEQAFKNMTSSGGMYGGLMEAQSKSVTGRIEQLKDAVDIILNEMGKASEGAIYGAISGAASLVENYEKVGKILVGLIATYGAYRTAVIVATVAEKGWTVAQLAHYNVLLIVEKAQKLLNKTMLANPYVFAATVLVGLVAAMWALRDSTTAAEKAQKDHNDRLNEAKTRFDELISVVRDETKAIEDRQEALENLRKLYPKLFADMDIEAVKLANLASLTKQATLAELDRERARAEQRITEIDTEIEEQSTKAGSNVNGALGRSVARNRIKVLNEEKKAQEEIRKAYYDQLNKDAELREKAEEEAEKAAAAAPRNKSFWDTQKKGAEDALAAMDASAKGSAEWNKQMALLNEANAKLQTWNFGGSKSSTQPQNDAKEAISLQRKYEDEVAQARVDAMNEGLEKVLAQNELNFQHEKAQIEDQYSKLSDAERQFLIDAAKTRKDAADAKAEADAQQAALDGFRSFEQEYLRLYSEFQTKRAAAEKGGADPLGLAKADAEFETQMQQLATKFAESDTQFKAWAEAIKLTVDGATADGSKEVLELAITQLEESLAFARDEVAKLMEGGIESGEGEALKNAYAKIEALQEQIKTLRSGSENAESPDKKAYKEWQKLYKLLGNVSDEFSQIGEEIGGVAGAAIKTVGEVSSSVFGIIGSIAQFSKMTSQSVTATASSASKAIQMVEKASVILAIIGAVLKVIQAITNITKANQEAAEAAAKANRDYAQSLHEIEITRRYEQHSNVFGTDGIGKFSEAVDVANDALKAMNKTASGLDNSTLEAFERNAIELTKQLNEGAISIDEFRNRADGIEADFRSKWQKFWGSGDKNIHAFNINDFWDGEKLDTEALQAWFDANKDGLDNYEKETLEGLIAAGEEYAAAIEIQTQYIEQLWGDLASSIADNMIEAFLETGDAASNLGDLVEDVAKNMAKSMIESMLFEDIFNDDLKNRLTGLLKSGDQTEANNLIKNAIESAGQLAPLFEGIMESVGLVAGVAKDKANEARTSASQGFAQASQDSIDKIDGILTNIQNHTHGIFELMKSGGSNVPAMTLSALEAPVLNIAEMMRTNQQIQQANTDNILGRLTNIDMNTRPIAEMQKDIHYMRGRTDDMADSLDKFTRG